MDEITIALAGNPNCGKTTVFNALTGAHQHIANYPGVTVETKAGRVQHRGKVIHVADLPGIYSLSAYSQEELIARDYLINTRPDLVVNVVDASNLDRNLYLTVQFRELGVPLLVVLNMMDMAEARGMAIDTEVLSQLMGAPVVLMVARARKGVEELLDAVVDWAGKAPTQQPLAISYGRDIDRALGELEDLIQRSTVFDPKYPPRWRALKCIEGDEQIVRLLGRDPAVGRQIGAVCEGLARHIADTLGDDTEGLVADYRYGYISGITRQAIKRRIDARLHWSDRIDQVLTNRILGPVFMFTVLYVIYAFTFWASEVPLAWMASFFDLLRNALTAALPAGHWRSLLVSGVIDGVGGVFGFVPLIMFMFLAIAVLEDSGYMARVAYMMDRVLRWFGLHGSSVMALVLGGGISGGCAVPGVMAARTLKDPKERIATVLVVPFMNCGAKLPVFAMLVGAFFVQRQAQMLFLITLLSWFFALFAAKILRFSVLRGPKTPFVMELPPYRLPTVRGLVIHTWERTWEYLKKAGTVILGFSILLWAVMTFPGLSAEGMRLFEKREADLTQEFLGAPGVGAVLKEPADAAQALALWWDLTAHPETVSGAPQGSPGVAGWVRNVFAAQTANRVDVPGAEAFQRYRAEIRTLAAQQRQAALEATVAGRLGKALEYVTRPLGFDYRMNIALLGGFAAKEVILSTLGTVYSLDQSGETQGGAIAERLKRDRHWNPLTALTFIVFVMLYAPCAVTVMTIWKETNGRWALFAVGFSLLLAYVVTGILRQGAVLVGLGVS